MNLFFLILASFLLETVGACRSDPIIDNGMNYDLNIEENCENHFPIHPDKSINLKLPCDSQYSLWMTVEETNDRIFHSNATLDCSRTDERFLTFQAPLNVGLIVVTQKTVTIKVLITDQKNVCAYPYIKLSSNETRVIQEDLTFDNLQECVYRIIPANDDFNSVNITFGSLDNLNYEQRIGKDVNIYNTSKVFDLVDSFDIKINPYVEIPEIKVQFINNECTKMHYFQMADNFLNIPSIPKPSDDQPCSAIVKSIIKIDFENLKDDEVIFMQHNVEKDNLKIMDRANDKVVMDETHWLKNAALQNITKLRITVTNKWDYVLNFTRVPIQHGCECPSYGNLVSTKSSEFGISFNSCKNVFCHIRLENPKNAILNVHFYYSQIPSGPSSDIFGVVEKGKYLPLNGGPHDFSLNDDYFEMSYIRLNNTSHDTMYSQFDWHFTRNFECSEDETRDVTPGSSIEITSINFPYPYPPNLDCKTLVKTDRNSTLEFNFKRFCSDGWGDVLEIYNGDTTDSDKMKTSLKGCKKPNQTIQTSSQALLLFQSDNITSSEITGYKIIVTAKPLYSTTSTTSATTTTSSTKNPPSTSKKSSSSNENPESSSSHVFLYIFVIFLIAAGGAGYFYQEKIKKLLPGFNFPLNTAPTTVQNVNFS
ncbi:unnamed protein product [Caenorhabditis angaria]|uniref:CUB domain-containing protein n=1 Tax=Caenorhabditis angaria TaxID=860376 RepID=A0A9P1I6F5_9PELO|nr:unnamed protein product [Caenorhabditis angaria]